MKSEGKSPAVERGFFAASAAWWSARLPRTRHLDGSLDAALFFDGLVGFGDAVEAGAGLLLVFGTHVAHLLAHLAGEGLEANRGKAFSTSSLASIPPLNTHTHTNYAGFTGLNKGVIANLKLCWLQRQLT